MTLDTFGEIRPVPVPERWQRSIENQLAETEGNVATVKVETEPGYVKTAAMLHLRNGWSFMGWLVKGEVSTVKGASVSKTF